MDVKQMNKKELNANPTTTGDVYVTQNNKQIACTSYKFTSMYLPITSLSLFISRFTNKDYNLDSQ
jgi:hypothetical protein